MNGRNTANNGVAVHGVVLATNDGTDVAQPRLIVRDDGMTLYCMIHLTDSSGIDADDDGVMDGTEMWMNYISFMMFR